MAFQDKPGFAAVIGDIRGSRLSADRGLLQTLLAGALHHVNDRVPHVQPLATTWGDEFQGLYRTLEDALEATLWVRLQLGRGEADVRFGVGWGFLVVFDAATVPHAQDGPVWWAAREALKAVSAEARRVGRPKGLRTWFLSFQRLYDRAEPGDKARWDQLVPVYPPTLGLPGDLPAGTDDFVNAYLLCRDQLVMGLDQKERASLMDLLHGKAPIDIAREESVTQSAISQRFIKNGSYALRTAGQVLREKEK